MVNIALTTARITFPNMDTLWTQMRAAFSDPSALAHPSPGGGGLWNCSKESTWLSAEVQTMQTLLDTVAAITPQLTAQRTVDQWPIELRALVLALIDQLNVIRAALPTPLGAITPAQALAAVRAKAGTL